MADVLDEIDRRLLILAQEDGRRPYAELAAEVGLSVSAVNERMRRLRARGVVTGVVALIAPRAVGLGVLAFVRVLLDGPEHEAAFRDGVVAAPEIQECHHITGEWSYLLKVRARDTGHLEDVLTTRIKVLPGVVRTHTVIALSSPKESSAIDVRSLPHDS
jgi:Lrp/AsnC family leucine-responsive transcriptional regulator